jgi:symplekin
LANSLQAYVLEDFRKRIDIAVAWLCEEWYNDRVQLKLGPNTPLHYEKWVLRLYDGFAQYLDGRDKILTRFLSEIPAVSTELLDRVKLLCRDPALVNLALTSLLYLVMMRPPVREIALDTVEDIWQRCRFYLTCYLYMTHKYVTDDEAKPIAAKYLNKWRPNFEQRLNKVEGEDKKLNGFANAIIADATKVAEAATS